MNILISKEYNRPVIQSKWIILGYQTEYWMENSMEEELWEDTTEMGRHQQEGLLIAAENKRMEETSREQGYLEGNY